MFVYNDGGRIAFGRKPMHQLQRDPMDCVVRALSIALDWDYSFTLAVLKEVAKQASAKYKNIDINDFGYRKGWPRFFYAAILERHGFIWVNANRIGKFNVLEMCDTWSDGSPMWKDVYVCRLPKHLTCVIDGQHHDVSDWFTDRVYGYWWKKEIGDG